MNDGQIMQSLKEFNLEDYVNGLNKKLEECINDHEISVGSR